MVADRDFQQKRIQALENALEQEISAHAQTRHRLEEHRTRLRELALQLCLTEAQERRAIAEDLHDHVGQALAVMRIRLEAFRGNAIFSGFSTEIDETLRLLAQTITFTRDLTGTISPPVLFELGLEDALDWLAERMQLKRGLKVTYRVTGLARDLRDEQKIMMFRSAQQLLRNVADHADTDDADIALAWFSDRLEISVTDQGRGFDVSATNRHRSAFGLFSIRERMRQLGGSVEVVTTPGQGTKVRLELPLDEHKGDQS